MKRGRGLAPLVGAGMAAVAAGSLVMFSLLAQQTALSPAPGNVIVPRGQEGGARPPILVAAPDEGSPTSPTPDSTIPFVTTSTTTPESTSPSDAPEGGDDTVEPEPEETVLASLDVSIRLDDALDFRGPLVDVRPRGPRPAGGEDPPGDDGDDGHDGDSCPGRPDKDRAKGDHPHGGPPACGNPHGGPPGQANKGGAGAASHAGPPASPGNSGESHGSGSGSQGPPSHADDHSSSGGGSQGGGSSSHSSPSAGGNGGSGGSSHPHGGPPGQAKKSSSGGGSGNSSGHPHGRPPGQAKK